MGVVPLSCMENLQSETMRYRILNTTSLKVAVMGLAFDSMVCRLSFVFSGVFCHLPAAFDGYLSLTGGGGRSTAVK